MRNQERRSNKHHSEQPCLVYVRVSWSIRMIHSSQSCRRRCLRELTTSRASQLRMKANYSHWHLNKEKSSVKMIESKIYINILWFIFNRAKHEYLATVPNINNPGVKSHDKYKNFANLVVSVSKSGEVAKKWVKQLNI